MDDVRRSLVFQKTLYQYETDKDDLVGKFIQNELESGERNIKCLNWFQCHRRVIWDIDLYEQTDARSESCTEYDLKKILSAALSENL